MDTATWVFTCKYWFSMSRITCLIIFSGSSARSIMSLRFARIKVPTRSKSPMVFLLSKAPNAAVSRAQQRQNGRQTILDHERQVTGNVRNGKRNDRHDKKPQH